MTGAGGHKVTPDVMQSPSPSSDIHQDLVTVTPPRHEPFVLNSRPTVYHVLNEENQEAYAHLDDFTNVPGHDELYCCLSGLSGYIVHCLLLLFSSHDHTGQSELIT